VLASSGGEVMGRGHRGDDLAVPSGKCVAGRASVSQDDALLGLLEGGVHVG